jgi:hypothetical protein
MKRKGWKLLINPDSVTWHLHEGQGGTRSHKQELYASDERIFIKKLNEWNIQPNEYKIFMLDNGLGDHIVFKKILPDLRKKHKNSKIVLGVCYREVFKDEPDIKMISIGECKQYVNSDEHNVYMWMANTRWYNSMEEAYRRMLNL